MFLPLYSEASFEEGKTACVLITNTQKIVASLLSKRQAVFISSEEAHYNMMDKMSEIIKCKRWGCFPLEISTIENAAGFCKPLLFSPSPHPILGHLT